MFLASVDQSEKVREKGFIFVQTGMCPLGQLEGE